MKIAFLTGSVSRNAGGMFTSIRRQAQTLASLPNVEVKIIGFRDEYTDEDLESWYPLKPECFVPKKFRPLGWAPEMLGCLKEFDPDIVHTQGLWMYTSIVALRWSQSSGRPYIISPRGMLDPWALNNSKFKKRIASFLFENAHLKNAACIHALCESEADSIRAYGLDNPIACIPNGMDIPRHCSTKNPPWQKIWSKKSNVMLYIGRLHPKKGLSNLINAWAFSKQQNGNFKDWKLAIFGWDQLNHENELKQLIIQRNLTEEVRLFGAVFGDTKEAALKSASAFVLPSFGEGFPISVLEAWAYSLPVVMTKQCNIPEGFSARAAIQIEPYIESITQGLKSFFSLPIESQKNMGQNGRTLLEGNFNWSNITSELINVYKWLLGKSDKPDCVRVF